MRKMKFTRKTILRVKLEKNKPRNKLQHRNLTVNSENSKKKCDLKRSRIV